jgi:hypothetical protein
MRTWLLESSIKNGRLVASQVSRVFSTEACFSFTSILNAGSIDGEATCGMDFHAIGTDKKTTLLGVYGAGGGGDEL